MTVKIKELAEEAKAKIDEAKGLLSKDEVTGADESRAYQLMDEAKGLQTRAARLQELDGLQAMMPDGDSIAKAGGHNVPSRDADSPLTRLDFIRAVKSAYQSGYIKVDNRLAAFTESGSESRKDLVGATGATGGFLLQNEVYDEIMGVAAPLTVVRQRANIVRGAGRTIDINAIDQAQSGTGGTFFGGMQVYWQSEASSIASTTPKFRQITMTAHELVAYTPISNSLMEDTNIVALTDYLTGEMGFPGAIAWAEDYAFIQGTGVGQPLGVINSGATITVGRATAGTVTYEDLAAMMTRHMGQNPVWVGNLYMLEQLLLMNGPSGNPVYLWGSAVDGVPNTLLGRPIMFTDKSPAVGSIGDLVLADWSYYTIYDRQSTTVRFSEDFLFRNNQVAARAVHRVDGQPWLASPITLADGSQQVSPFVMLGNVGS